jgi:hypothetical protein
MQLTSLDCRHTDVSDADVKALAGLTTLQWLSLWGTRVKDAGLKELAGLKRLQWLSLETTQVTDAGLKALAPLQSLEHLSLYNVGQVTDAGLKELAGLKALKYLDLRGTSVTDPGAKKLASVLPSLRIEMWGGAIGPKASLDPDRRAAEHVLAIGGRVRVNDENQEIEAAANLPPEAFRLRSWFVWLRRHGLSCPTAEPALDQGLVLKCEKTVDIRMAFQPKMTARPWFTSI